MELREQIACYRPVNAQEEKDKEQLLAWLGSGIDLYSRDCAAAHLTASAWVVSPDRKKVLMAYHKIYNSVAEAQLDLYSQYLCLYNNENTYRCYIFIPSLDTLE